MLGDESEVYYWQISFKNLSSLKVGGSEAWGRGWHQVTKIQIKCCSLVKSKKKNGAAWVLSGREEMAMQRYTKVASASGVEISKSGMMSSQKNGE
ncbi:hypothetical protein ACOSQ4_006611 [Xanthoceras sorbifolium]